MALRPEDRPTYAAAVWETFQARYQPGRLTMSSAEFQTIARWMDRGLPLRIVLRGIEDMGNSKPRTIMACERPVERAYEQYYHAMGLIG